MTKQYTKAQVKENRIRWIEALESGDYEKGVHVLRDEDDCYCCLGVACELFVPETRVPPAYKRHYMYEGSSYSDAPESVINALGLNDSFGVGLNEYIGSVKDGNGRKYYHLADCNDQSDMFEPVIEAIKTGHYWKDLRRVWIWL